MSACSYHPYTMTLMLQITPIPAFSDNYIWLLSQDFKPGLHAAVVDPGDAGPVIELLESKSLTLDAILITHHHADHMGGVADLLTHSPDAVVYAPKKWAYPFAHIAVEENDCIRLENLNLDFTVMEIPGHTLDHIAYYGADCLFCGDTLFSAGCGRLFEGTPEQMYQSLQRIASLPAQTLVYCAHEYTQHNLDFATTVDPDNRELLSRKQQVAELRSLNKPSLPSTIATELASNPFLRCSAPAIQANSGSQETSPIEVFAAIREMRNHF